MSGKYECAHSQIVNAVHMLEAICKEEVATGRQARRKRSKELVPEFKQVEFSDFAPPDEQAFEKKSVKP